jgi:uncharacterized membrane protein YesL
MNFEKFVGSKLYGFFDKAYIIFFTNLIFTLLTVIGLGVFTFYPALISLFIVINSALIDNEKVSVSSMFKIFRKEFFKSFKISLVFLFSGLLFAFNTYYFYYCFNNPEITNLFYAFSLYLTIFIDFLFIICFIHSLLIYIYFPHLTIKRILKYSVVFSLSFIKENILLMVLIIVFILISMMFFYLLPMILVGLFAFLVLLIFHKQIMKLVKDNPYLSANEY